MSWAAMTPPRKKSEDNLEKDSFQEQSALTLMKQIGWKQFVQIEASDRRRLCRTAESSATLLLIRTPGLLRANQRGRALPGLGRAGWRTPRKEQARLGQGLPGGHACVSAPGQGERGGEPRVPPQGLKFLQSSVTLPLEPRVPPPELLVPPRAPRPPQPPPAETPPPRKRSRRPLPPTGLVKSHAAGPAPAPPPAPAPAPLARPVASGAGALSPLAASR
ncbi:PREDICTED: WAS/WASL-interacting protein family member 3-like, partial [Chinchilla lanigera]|uniref:WAS/WASL-interacting protein family member 3-like n=1 Tax=Chinchilla lanigera TaxID=34839 RepID=UPI000697F199